MAFTPESEKRIPDTVILVERGTHGNQGSHSRQRRRARYFGTGPSDKKFGTLNGPLDGEFPGAPASVSIYELNIDEGGIGTWDATGETEDDVYGPFILGTETLDPGTKVIIELLDDGRWYVTTWNPIDGPEVETISVVTALQVDGNNLQIKTTEVTVLKKETEGDWSTWHEGTDCS